MLARAKVLSKDDFEVQKKARFQKVMKTLDTATVSPLPFLITVTKKKLLFIFFSDYFHKRLDNNFDTDMSFLNLLLQNF